MRVKPPIWKVVASSLPWLIFGIYFLARPISLTYVIVPLTLGMIGYNAYEACKSMSVTEQGIFEYRVLGSVRLSLDLADYTPQEIRDCTQMNLMVYRNGIEFANSSAGRRRIWMKSVDLQEFEGFLENLRAISRRLNGISEPAQQPVKRQQKYDL
jgi:hypothetical protein